MSEGRVASGFRCPQCGEDESQAILDLKLPMMELQCQWCGYEWATEV